jgi:hypothetical protein
MVGFEQGNNGVGSDKKAYSPLPQKNKYQIYVIIYIYAMYHIL